jgi:hypothetical protein
MNDRISQLEKLNFLRIENDNVFFENGNVFFGDEKKDEKYVYLNYGFRIYSSEIELYTEVEWLDLMKIILNEHKEYNSLTEPAINHCKSIAKGINKLKNEFAAEFEKKVSRHLGELSDDIFWDVLEKLMSIIKNDERQFWSFDQVNNEKFKKLTLDEYKKIDIKPPTTTTLINVANAVKQDDPNKYLNEVFESMNMDAKYIMFMAQLKNTLGKKINKLFNTKWGLPLDGDDNFSVIFESIVMSGKETYEKYLTEVDPPLDGFKCECAAVGEIEFSIDEMLGREAIDVFMRIDVDSVFSAAQIQRDQPKKVKQEDSLDTLKTKMQDAVNNEDYELAAKLRDKINEKFGN